MKKYIILIAALFLALCCYEYGFARSWDDLDEGEHKIYGREKEEKYPIKAFFIEKEEWENHYSLMVLWLYKYTDYPKYTSTRFLPFYYGLDSKIDNRSMTLLPLLLSYFETDGDQKKSYIVLPLYYSSISTDTSDRSLLFLIWWGKDFRSNWIDSYQTILPIFYHSSKTNPERSYGEYLWVNPLFVSWRETTSYEEKEHLWWAPVIPLTFHYTDKYGGHRNIFWILDYSWDREDESDSMKRFWFFPFYFWKSGNDGYTVTLLFGRKIIREENSNEYIYSNFWFPIIPVFFRSNDRIEGTHTNVAWLIDWASNTDGELDRFWLIPFVFHQTGEDGYKYYIPFYCKPSGATETEGYTFGIFHYYAWRESGSTIWSWLYYSRDDYVENVVKDVKGDNEVVGGENFYYTHFLPLYWSWRSEESQGRLILPLYYQYKDEQSDIYINGLGIAKSAYMGPFNPSVSASLTNKDDNWYLDSETSWLYEVWSSSSRVPIKNPFGSKDNISNISQETVSDNENIDSESEQKTGLTSGVERKGRENSEFFWGWKILFGWIAYEKADSQKHVRFFPLTWLTWNENSEDKVYVFLPLFVSYLSEDTKTEYFVIFPFYLMQKEDQSYFKLYLINLYIDEYESSEDYHDKSILWPIINWYSSPDRNGFRIFPFFWSKNWNDGTGESYSSMFLPFYRRSVEPDSKSLIIFPALSYFNEDQDGKTKFIAGTYWHRSKNYERENILYIYDHKKYLSNNSRSDEYSFLFTTIEFDFEENYKEMRMLWRLLFKYESYKKTGYYDIDAFLWLAGIERDGDYFHNRILPIYWYSSDSDSSYLVLPPVLSFFSKDGGDNFDLGILGLIYYRNEDRSFGSDRRMWLLGALYNEVKYPERRYHARGTLWGILWDYETEDDGYFKKFTILKGLYKYINDNGKTEHSLFWIF
ncbi:MAG: hypothetical protein FWH53_01955 [Leptospirales bacterium]|nr:hypothetical protein [Leptospirales bacterium]